MKKTGVNILAHKKLNIGDNLSKVITENPLSTGDTNPFAGKIPAVFLEIELRHDQRLEGPTVNR